MSPHIIGPNAILHHLQLCAEQPQRLAEFYARTMMMQATKLGDDHLCEGPARRLLFTKGQKQQLGFAAFAFETETALADYREQVETNGLDIAASPSPLFDKSAFSVRDPDGNLLVFGTANLETIEPTENPDARLQHVTMRSKVLNPFIQHYSQHMSFFLADMVCKDGAEDVRTAFFASNEEHHSLAVFQGDEIRVDHHSYELSGWDMIRDWADHFASLGLTLRWGPGRHGPGNNLFIFLEDPEGNWIELSAELEIMGPERTLGRWPHAPRTLNLWGDAIMRS